MTGATAHANDGRTSVEPLQRLCVTATYPGRVPPDFAPLSQSILTGSLADLLEQSVARHAARTAVVEPARRITYAEFDVEANRYAHALLAQLGDGEEPVAIIMSLDDPAFPALYGVLKAGKIYVVLDPADPPARVQLLLDHLETRAVITAARHAPLVEPHLRTGRILLVAEEVGASALRESPRLALTPDRGAAIFFTSGSTGVPKGVLASHAKLLNSAYLTSTLNMIAASDRQAVTAFPGFIISAHNLLGALAVGAAVYPLNPQTHNATHLLAEVRTAEISIMSPAPTLLRELMSAAGDDAHLPSLRLVNLVGQSIYAGEIAYYRRVLGSHVVFAHTYGSSEAGRVATGFIHAQTPLVDARVPAGYLTGDCQVRIVDEHGQEMGPEQVGQIVVRSRYMASGYWRDTAATQARFNEDPDEAGVRLYHTGDRGLLRADGCLELYGRTDNMVKVRGYRVELEAIDVALLTHPDVLHAATVTRPLPHGEAVLAAYVTPRAGSTPAVSDLRAHVAAQLPAWMVPARLIILETMPMTPTGKVNRRALPPLGNQRPELATPYMPPETPLQVELAELWAEALELESVGIDDSFVELGGDSLRAVRILTQVKQRYGRALTVADWLATPTLRRLATLIELTEPSAPVSQGDHVTTPTPSSTPTAQNRRVQTSPRSSRSNLARRALGRLTFQGPVAGGVRFPYVLGNRLRLAWLRLPWVRRVILGKTANLFERWRTAAQLDDPDGRLLELFLFNNTWRTWHATHLKNPAIRARWVHTQGLDGVSAAVQAGQGAVFAFLHMGIKGGVSRLMVTESVLPETVSLPGVQGATSEREALIRRAELVRQTGEVLGRGGGVFVAGDGLHGTDGVVYPFHGRNITFYRGGAHLAVMYGAPIIPTSQQAGLDGHVWVEYGTPLFPPNQGNERSRTDDLLDRYVQVLAAQWPHLLPGKSHGHLQRWWDASTPLEG